MFRSVILINSRWKLNPKWNEHPWESLFSLFLFLFSLPFLPPVLSVKMRGESDPFAAHPFVQKVSLSCRLASS